MPVLIISHTFTTGALTEMEKYLKGKVELLGFIDHPFSYKKGDLRSNYRLYEGGDLVTNLYAPKISGPDILFFFKDFLFTLFFAIRVRKKYDLCIAADNLNALAAWVLKKLHFFDKLIYYTIDYSPRRFENKLLNKIYHAIDRFVFYRSDLNWVYTDRMDEQRALNGVDLKKAAPRIKVTEGCNFSKIKRLPFDRINRHQLVFLGHILKKQGLDLVADALPEVAKRVPQVSWLIVGMGDYEGALKKRIKEKGLEKYVEFKGFVADHREVEGLLAKCAIGLAPYLPDPTSFTYFTEPGKVKIYLACGLPVIITAVPELATDIQRAGAGIMIQYEKSELEGALIKLLTDDEFYKNCREMAINFASRYEWSTVFERAFKDSGVKL